MKQLILFVAVVFTSAFHLAQSSDGTTSKQSPWGGTESGLRCRLTLPGSIEQGMEIPATVELEADRAKLPPGVRQLNGFMHEAFLIITLTDPKTGRQFDIEPFPYAGPPISDPGTELVTLDGRRLKPWRANFPLVTVYSSLPPADYVCRVKFSYPEELPAWERGSAAIASDPATWWRGTVVSGDLHLEVLPETPKSQVFWIPKRLVVTKELINLHSSDQPVQLAAIPVIRFNEADAQMAKLHVRNGHFLNTRIEARGGLRFLGGTELSPDGFNDVDRWYDYTGGDRSAEYRIQVFESAAPCGHLMAPGAGSPGYRLLWSNTFPVSINGKEFQRLPVTVLQVPAGTSNSASVALIQANPEVQELSAGNTGLRDGDLQLIGRLRHLRILYLHDNDITDAGVAQLRNLTHLKALCLDRTKVTGAGLLQLGNLSQLEKLQLRRTRITDAGAAVVGRLAHLKLLDLAGTRIGDATMTRLRELKELEWLDLSGTEVTDKGLQNLLQLPHLKDLRLPMTATDERVEAINQALPDCRVEKVPDPL